MRAECPGARGPRQPRHRVVEEPAGLAGRERRNTPSTCATTASSGRCWRCQARSGRGAEQLWRRLRVAHLEHPGPGGEGPSAEVGDQPGPEDLRSRAPRTAQVLVVHHNVLAGGISGRMGLARWRSAHRRLLATGADVILCGHDHQEGAGTDPGRRSRSAPRAPTATGMRGGRPSVFNLVTIDAQSVHIQHFRWVSADSSFMPSDNLLCPEGPAQGGGLGRGWGSGTVKAEDVSRAAGGLGPPGNRAGRHPHQPHCDAQPQPAGPPDPSRLRLCAGPGAEGHRPLPEPPRSPGAPPRGRAGVPGVPGGGHAPSGRGASAASRPAPATCSCCTGSTASISELNAAALRRDAGEIPIRLSGRMRTRLGELSVDIRTGLPDSRSPSAAGISPRHSWAEVEHTLLHEMVHQWQAENGATHRSSAHASDRRHERWEYCRQRRGR